MAQKRHGTEPIVAKLRESENLVVTGSSPLAWPCGDATWFGVGSGASRRSGARPRLPRASRAASLSALRRIRRDECWLMVAGRRRVRVRRE